MGRGSTLERLNTRLSSVKANLENLKSRRLRIENPMLLIKLPIIQHDSLLKNYWARRTASFSFFLLLLRVRTN